MTKKTVKNVDILASLKALGLDPRVIDSINAVGNQHGEFRDRVIQTMTQNGWAKKDIEKYFGRAENFAKFEPDPKKSQHENLIAALKAGGFENQEFIRIDEKLKDQMKKPGIRSVTKDDWWAGRGGDAVPGFVDFVNAAGAAFGFASPILNAALDKVGATYKPTYESTRPSDYRPPPIGGAPAPAPAPIPVQGPAPKPAPKAGSKGPGVVGGGAGGGGGGPGAGSLAPAKRGAGDVDEFINKNYGHVAYLLSIPEIAQFVKDAEKDGWDDSRIRGALEGSSWWQKTSEAQRLYQDQKMTDPATAARSREKMVGNIKQEAAKYGLNISDPRLNEIADNALTMGWNEAETAQAMAHEFHYKQDDPNAAALVGQLKATAGDYYIPLSDAAIQQWGESIIANQGDDTMFKQYVKDQAKSMFPTAAGAIDRGVSIKTFTDPYRQLASQYLEVDPDSIDFSDPKYLKALNMPDPKTGDNRLMSLSEWTDNIKRDPAYGWDKTENARSQATDLAGKIAAAFGGGL